MWGQKMTPENRTALVTARTGNYLHIMRTTIFTLVAIAAVIELGPDGYSAPLTMLVIATAAYGILAGGSALDDMINLRGDMDEATAQSSYGKGINARNLPALKTISSVLLGLIAIAELYAIFM
jgi:hypothetical protein